MEYHTISDARALAEAKLDKDRGRIIGLIGLRLAQIKHVLLQLQKLDDVQDHPERVERLKAMMPPNSDDWVLEYALNTHDFFLKKVSPLLVRSENGEVRKWASELETALEDIRRLVVQNLSKHPAMKPYRALGVLQEEWDESNRLLREREECAIEYAGLQHEWQRIQDAKHEAQSQPAFDTLVRLEESRESLMNEKRAILDQWVENWKRVEPIFNRLMEKSKTFERMENAQLRMLQLYLANPVSARMKDPRGAGFLMLLRLAVDAIEEKKVFSPGEREMVRELLLEAMQNPSFSAFFERTFELDQAIEGNLREYYNHPLHHRLNQIESEGREVARKMQEVQSLGESVHAQYEEKRKSVARLVREADELCRNNLGVGIILPE